VLASQGLPVRPEGGGALPRLGFLDRRGRYGISHPLFPGQVQGPLPGCFLFKFTGFPFDTQPLPVGGLFFNPVQNLRNLLNHLACPLSVLPPLIAAELKSEWE
jgi:hypothetical protein